jgi:hypothetical protein
LKVIIKGRIIEIPDPKGKRVPDPSKKAAVPTFVSHSEAGQDVFVYEQLVKPFNNYSGTFLDIGCAVPIWINNTYSLEQMGWRGLLVDWSAPKIVECRRERTSPALEADATKVNWLATCREHGLGTKIDYLSLDLDDQPGEESITLFVLKSLMSFGFEFRAITVEHDCYRLGDASKLIMRELLLAQGYNLFAGDVYNRPPGEPRVQFEDWWLKL